jgi:protein arginine kinase activator
MRCDHCGKSDAVIHLTKVENNEMKTSYLCENCASDKGFGTSAPASAAPLTDFLAQMGKGLGTEAPSPAAACSSCGLTVADFKRTGRLGCAACYSQLDVHLRGLLRRLHGGTSHAGKVVAPHPDAPQEDQSARVSSLRRSLQQAVDREDFERAAVLRDQIRRIESASAAAGDA